MMDYITLGGAPYEEECAQVGDEGYRQRALKECAAYIGQLKRAFGEPPAGASLRVKRFPHDFGTYHEVVVEFEDEPAAIEYAFKLEEEMPARWDEQARRELGL